MESPLKRAVAIELSIRKALSSGAWKAVDELQCAVYADIGISIGSKAMLVFIRELAEARIVEVQGDRGPCRLADPL